MNKTDLDAAFEQLCTDLSNVENKYGTAETPARPALQLVETDQIAPAEDPEPAEEDLTAAIAELNDIFRQSQPKPCAVVPGDYELGPSIKDMSEEDQAKIVRMVADVRDFTPENDPHGLHDRGVVEHPAGAVQWLIDVVESYENSDPAQHPEDPNRSFRILWIALADEFQE